MEEEDAGDQITVTATTLVYSSNQLVVGRSLAASTSDNKGKPFCFSPSSLHLITLRR